MKQTTHLYNRYFGKNIADAPARLQRILLRCLRFDIDIKYRPGPTIPVADALSRVCVSSSEECHTRKETVTGKGFKEENFTTRHEINFVEGIKKPIDNQRIKEAASVDITYNTLKNMVYRGWPDQRKQCPTELHEYWNFRCDLVLDDGLVLKGNRTIIPEALRKDVLTTLHTGHQGETKTILLARETVFWPGITNDIRKMVQSCEICAKFQNAQPRMPILQPDLPTEPWQKLGTDIFDYQGGKYLIVVDYYSRYPIIRKLDNITAKTVSDKFTSLILEFGIPQEIVADFGTQYTSEEFRKRCSDSSIKLTFSAPHHHQANSVAERAVGTVKQLWKKAQAAGQCPGTALWIYRTTPLDNNLPSPYEMLFNMKPRRFLPTKVSRINSSSHDDNIHRNQERQNDQARFYNKRNANINLRELYPNEPVSVYNTIKRQWEPGHVVKQTEPRTYVVDKNGRQLYRTREHIKPRSAPVPMMVDDYNTNVMPTNCRDTPDGETSATRV